MTWTLMQRLFRAKGNKSEAKNRLQIVLFYDRLGLSAEQVEALRKDIMETINRHIAIDLEGVKIDFQSESSPAVFKVSAPVIRGRAATETPKQQPSVG